MSSSPSASNSASASASRGSGSVSLVVTTSGSSVTTIAASSTATISIPATAAAGGLTVTQPPSTGSTSYYKIASDDYITFGWNFTSLYVQPKSLTVVASCSANGNTYLVGPTTSPYNVLPGNATNVIWNPWQWEQLPGQTAFAEATYVLSIWDERGPTAAVKGGYMSPYSGTEFALYLPQPYTPIASGWTCSTCSAAYRLAEPAALSVMTSFVIMIITTIAVLRR